jgi:gliding motility-associated-like protein
MNNKFFGIIAFFAAFIALPSAGFAQCTTTATNTGPYCPDATALLFAGSGGVAYSWAGPAGFMDTNANTSVLNAQVANGGVYTVTVTFSNGCTASSTTRVVVNPKPGAIASAPAPTTFCEGTILALSATGGGAGGRYLWSGPNIFTSALQNPSIASASAAASGTYNVVVTNSFGCTNVAALSIVINPAPAVTIVQTGNTCAGSSLTLTGSANNAVGYAWTGVNGAIAFTPDLTLNSITANDNGSYFVSVTDANNCVGTASTLVSVTTITGSVSPTTPICEGGTIALNASGGTLYTWTGPNGFLSGGNAPIIASATPADAGTYNVTISDANGCTVAGATLATVNPNPTATTTATDATCYLSSNGTITAVPAAGTAPFGYAWSNGTVGVDNITGLSVGTYNVTVTDVNGCTAITSGTIAEPTALNVQVVQIQNATCANSNDGGATAQVTGGTGAGTYTYLWSNGATTFKVTNIPCGQGTVLITDAKLCTVQQSFNIECPALLQLSDSVGTTVNCNGGSDGGVRVNIVGGITPYTYNWAAQPANNTNVLSGVSTGTYTVDIIDANGCTAGPFSVFVPQPAAPMTITMTGTPAICNGSETGTAIATAVGGTLPYNYLWSPAPATGTSSPTAVDLPIGVYTTTVTDTRGCSITGDYTVTEPTPVSVTAVTTATDCYGDDNGYIQVNGATGGNGPYEYSLDNANFQLDTIFDGLPASQYIVYAADKNGCLDTAMVRINQPDPIQLSITNGSPIILEMGNSVEIITNTNVADPTTLQYIWSKPISISCTSCPNPTVNPLSPITYNVQVTDLTGCTAQASVVVDVQKNRNVFIPNIFTPNNDSNNDEFMVYAGLGVVRVKDLKIFDRWGEMVYADSDFIPNDRTHSWNGKFKGEALRTGVFVYIMEIEFVDGLTIPYKGDVTLVR